ncbi:MAG: hypothetical protein ACYDHD_04710 [Vulcanimicrobiaceae bacterium]
MTWSEFLVAVFGVFVALFVFGIVGAELQPQAVSAPATPTIATPSHSNRQAIEAKEDVKEDVMMRRWRHAMNADLGYDLFVANSVTGGVDTPTANITLNTDTGWDSLSTQDQNMLFQKAVIAFKTAYLIQRPNSRSIAALYVNFRDLSGTKIKDCGWAGC